MIWVVPLLVLAGTPGIAAAVAIAGFTTAIYPVLYDPLVLHQSPGYGIALACLTMRNLLLAAAYSLFVRRLLLATSPGSAHGGKPDIVTANFWGHASVLLNASGTFSRQSDVDAGVANGYVVVGDFDGDGIPDLVFGANGLGGVGAYLGNGDGTFRQAACAHAQLATRSRRLASARYLRSPLPPSGLASTIAQDCRTRAPRV